MSQFDQAEIENYAYGSPLWAGSNDPVLAEGVNEDVFWGSFLGAKGGRGFSRIDCEENRATLLEKYADRYPGELIVRSRLSDLWYGLMITRNDAGFIDPQAEPEDTRPRDAQGRLLSAEAIRNQEYLDWTEGKSDLEIRQRRGSDAGFAAFYSATLRAQVQSDDPMAQANYRNNIRTDSGSADQVLRNFAADYAKMPMTEVRRRMSPSTNPAGYKTFTATLEACFAAGML